MTGNSEKSITIAERVRENVGVPQSQAAALPRHQEEEETDKTKQVQINQTYEKHQSPRLYGITVLLDWASVVHI